LTDERDGMSAVEVRNLCVELEGHRGVVVEDVSFAIDAGEIVGLAGETGSGKTTIANALAGHARRGARITAGSIVIDADADLLSLSDHQLERIRGSVVAFVPQDPSASLNPSLRIGAQLQEMFECHPPRPSKLEQREQIAAMLREVSLPDSPEFLRRYPHQLSGGQEQRVVLAMAFLRRPRLVIMDEPTTGLDVTVQTRILTMVRHLCREHQAAVLYVTHDLAVLSELADRILIAYAGRLVEVGSREAIFREPAHPYARQLLAAIPDIAERRALRPIPGSAPAVHERPSHCAFAARCSLAIGRCLEEQPSLVAVGTGHLARCFRVAESRARIAVAPKSPLGATASRAGALLSVDHVGVSYGRQRVLFDVSLTISAGELVALVGESGSGKTTLARMIMGAVASHQGVVAYDGQVLDPDFRRRSAKVRRELQYIFQSPFRSLNPRRTIGDSVGTPLELFTRVRGQELTNRVTGALERVAIPKAYMERYPDQLSGGERQRVAIARALACDPRILICDEVTSALDVSVQAAIVELLQGLQHDTGLAMLFITHNLALVRSIAERVVVINDGRIVEEGPSEGLLTSPQQPYTRTLIQNTPSILATDQARENPTVSGGLTVLTE
jgi:peptide/nickel transport system ATP-binding protein